LSDNHFLAVLESGAPLSSSEYPGPGVELPPGFSPSICIWGSFAALWVFGVVAPSTRLCRMRFLSSIRRSFMFIYLFIRIFI